MNIGTRSPNTVYVHCTSKTVKKNYIYIESFSYNFISLRDSNNINLLRHVVRK